MPEYTEAMRILSLMKDIHRLMASLLYGSGLRLMECVRLGVKDQEPARFAPVAAIPPQ